MEIQKNQSRFWMEDESGSTVAELDFPEAGDGTVEITHTWTDDSLRGQGIAGKMTEELALQLRAENRKAVLTCPYAKGWFARHPEYGDVVEEQ